MGGRGRGGGEREWKGKCGVRGGEIGGEGKEWDSREGNEVGRERRRNREGQR